ncbi:hypothetical protein GALL_183080 [mine drainage metagenome]|uniref:Uncharacterized protein n=1 Tax=mine drainage metagenome TaxID=410659 RepID=A0A1J5S625_9ZZZZ
MVSIMFQLPMRMPSREPGSTCGERLMLSCPPATTISASPSRTACAASITAFRPEPQTLLMVMAGTMSGRPALMLAWRAAFWPTPACRTCPRMTSETWPGSMPTRSMAVFTTSAPRSTADVLASDPPNLPTAVRTADTITMSSLMTGCPW